MKYTLIVTFDHFNAFKIWFFNNKKSSWPQSFSYSVAKKNNNTVMWLEYKANLYRTVIAEMVQISLMRQGKSWLIFTDIFIVSTVTAIGDHTLFSKDSLAKLRCEEWDFIITHKRHSCDPLSTSINYLRHNLFLLLPCHCLY